MRAEGRDHAGNGEQAAVLRDDAEEIADQPADAGLVERWPRSALNCSSAEKTGLLIRRVEIGALVEHRLEAAEIGLDLRRPMLAWSASSNSEPA